MTGEARRRILAIVLLLIGAVLGTWLSVCWIRRYIAALDDPGLVRDILWDWRNTAVSIGAAVCWMRLLAILLWRSH